MATSIFSAYQASVPVQVLHLQVQVPSTTTLMVSDSIASPVAAAGA